MFQIANRQTLDVFRHSWIAFATACLMVCLFPARSVAAQSCMPHWTYVTDNPHIAPKGLKVQRSEVFIRARYETASIFPPALTRKDLQGAIFVRLDSGPTFLVDALRYVGSEFRVEIRNLSEGKHRITVGLVRGRSETSSFGACVEIPSNLSITHFR